MQVGHRGTTRCHLELAQPCLELLAFSDELGFLVCTTLGGQQKNPIERSIKVSIACRDLLFSLDRQLQFLHKAYVLRCS